MHMNNKFSTHKLHHSRSFRLKDNPKNNSHKYSLWEPLTQNIIHTLKREYFRGKKSVTERGWEIKSVKIFVGKGFRYFPPKKFPNFTCSIFMRWSSSCRILSSNSSWRESFSASLWSNFFCISGITNTIESNFCGMKIRWDSSKKSHESHLLLEKYSCSIDKRMNLCNSD